MSAVVGLFLQVLPLAVGAAMSPTFLAMQIVVLTNPAPGALRRGWALAAGSMLMLLLITFGGVSLLAYLPHINVNLSWSLVCLLVIAAVVLLLIAVFESHKPPGRKDPTLDKIVDAKPPVIFIIGAGRLAINASTLALYLPAVHIIFDAQVDIVAKTVAFVILFALTELAVLGPVLYVTLRGEKAKPALLKIHDEIDAHAKEVTIWVCRIFAVLLLLLAAWDVWRLV